MLGAAIGFFILALVAYVLGAYGLVGISMEIGRILLFTFLAISIISFIASLFTGGKPKGLT